MAFVQLLFTASKLKRLKNELAEEKNDAIKIFHKQKPKTRFRHIGMAIRFKLKRCLRTITDCFCFRKTCYRLKRYGSFENFIMKSILGFVGGFILTYIFFTFSIFQLNFKITTATVMCSILGCILMIGLAFSTRVRCIVLLTLPQFFSQKGRQALLAYAFILAISGPAKNTLNNLGIMSESLACGQEQLKSAVRQILEVIKKPFYAIRDAIKKVVKTIKEVVKKIKEILMVIKRIIMAIVRVIKAAFQFLAKIINICNKELGTPFERCQRVFENAILDCNAKLGPMFNWLCSITYLIKTVCYMVKVFDLVCMIVDFISDSIIGVVIRSKLSSFIHFRSKNFIRQVRTMFYVRIRFSHSYHFQTNTSKTLAQISHGIVSEIKDRTQTLQAVFHFLTSAATLFFIFIIFKVTYYRFKFLTSEKFDNKYITSDFHKIDLRRAKWGKETVLPLNNRELELYISMNSKKLVKSEKKALTKAITTLATATGKLIIYMVADYSLFWILNLIKYYGRFQSKVQAPNIPKAHISGNGLLADLLRGIVKAFQPMGIELEIDTVPCLPTPIPPDYDRYVQIAILIVLCWILTVLEPYGLRLRNTIMCYYHPTRAKQRSIWLYNHIMRSRNSFLKFARRQLRRKVFGGKGIEKITCKEYLAANFRIFAICFDKPQTSCLLCGQVFRESDDKKPIKCQTPGCPGIYCEECFADLQNLCTVCLSPIEYGDLSDISEEKDSSEDEPRKITERKRKSWCRRKKAQEEEEEEAKRGWWCFKKDIKEKESSGEGLQAMAEGVKIVDKTVKTKKWKWCRKDVSTDEEDETIELLTKDEPLLSNTIVEKELKKEEDIGSDAANEPHSDYYSSDNSTDYSYSYQYDKSEKVTAPLPPVVPFKDVEKQEIPDYASMDSFREEQLDEAEEHDIAAKDLENVIETYKESVGTSISGITFDKTRLDKRVEFIGVPKKSKESVAKKKSKKKKLSKTKEEIPLLEPALCVCTTDSDSDYNEAPSTTLPRSTTSTSTKFLRPLHTSDSFSSVDSKIRERLEKERKIVSKLDLSTQTDVCVCTKPMENKFSNVVYGEISESPRSTSSSKSMTSSTNLSTIAGDLIDLRETQHSQEDTLRGKDGKTSETEIVSSEARAGQTEQPTVIDTNEFGLKQRKKVKEYYKAVKDIPVTKAEVSRKPSKFKSFFQRILPKRKRTTDELPLYSTDRTDVVELKTFKPPENQRNFSSSEEDEEHERFRGGGPIFAENSCNSSLTCQRNSGGLSKYIQIDFFPKPTVSKETLSGTNQKYSFRIEDLTPTRDTGFSMNSPETVQLLPSNIPNVLTEEIPEKEIPFPQLHAQGSDTRSLYLSARSVQFSKDQIIKSASSVLSEDLCYTILGTPYGALKNYQTPSEQEKIAGSEVTIIGTEKHDSAVENNPVDIDEEETVISNTNLVDLPEPNKISVPNRNQIHRTPSMASKNQGANNKSPELDQNLQDKRSASIGSQEVSSQAADNLGRSSMRSTASLRKQGELCDCKNQKIQTSHPSILKQQSSQKSIITIKDMVVKIGNGENLSTEEEYPKKNSSKYISDPNADLPACCRMKPEREKILLTSDKIQQTSDLSFSLTSTTNGSCKCRTANPSANSLRSESIQTTSNIIDSTNDDSLGSATTSSNAYGVCRCLEVEIPSRQGGCACCSCPPPPPPPIQYAEVPASRCYRNISPQRNIPRCIDRYPSEKSIRSSRKRTTKPPQKTCREYPETSGYSLQEEQYEDFRRWPETSCRYENRSTIPAKPRAYNEHVCPGNGDCRCFSKKPKSYRPSPPSVPTCKYHTVQFDSSSSEEEPDDEDNESYYSDSSPYCDLPYQNNDDYMDLVQELEETLMTRNKNRVKRAMQEFENRSRYNKPLEKPIINYDETSESEEPIIRRISQLTEKGQCCTNDTCTCERDKERRKKNYHPRQVRQQQYPKPARRPQTCAKPKGASKIRWQMDIDSGEWYKVCGNLPGRRRSKTPSPRKDDYSRCNCEWCQ